MAGSVNSCVRICLGIVQKKTLSFPTNSGTVVLKPLSFSSKTFKLASFSTQNPYRFPAFAQTHVFVALVIHSPCPPETHHHHLKV